MKLTCTQEKFKKAILNAEKVTSKQNTLPILNNILFETENNTLKVIATNLEIGISNQVGAKIEEEGRITVPAKLISNFVNNLPSGENIQIEVNNQDLRIKSGFSKAIIKGMFADEFPLLPKKNTEYILILSSLKLKNIINKVIGCVAVNETRQELTGVNFVFTENEIFFASTDSFRLIEDKIILEEKNKKENYLNFIKSKNNIIVPANTLTEISRVINNDVDEDISVAIEEGQIFFEIGGVGIVSRLINGKYPEYKHIIPNDFQTKIIGEKNIIQGAVKMSSVFSKTKNSEIVFKINSEEEKFSIEARSVECGENSTELNLDVTGPSQEVVFNAKYFLDGINIINTKKIAILMNNESSPVAIKEVDEKTNEVMDKFIYIVMPIKG
jgi:DNA polymerase-3 subunit beta